MAFYILPESYDCTISLLNLSSVRNVGVYIYLFHSSTNLIPDDLLRIELQAVMDASDR